MASNPMMIAADAQAARAVDEYLVNLGKRINDVENAVKVDENGHHYMFDRVKGSVVMLPELDRGSVPISTLDVFCLDGLVSFISADVDDLFCHTEPEQEDRMTCHLVRIVSPTEVDVLSPLMDIGTRETVVRCKACIPYIKFGQYMDIDEFQIMLQSMFKPSENLTKVLQISGSLRSEQTAQYADDGVSQRVTVRSGVVSNAEVTVKNPVTLTPIRTFTEVEQPESNFILRFNDKAQCALFEGDGGAWKIDAVRNIATYLGNKLKNCNVVVI